jgi:hypothetical protein
LSNGDDIFKEMITMQLFNEEFWGKDSNRIAFFGISHVLGWTLANLQTIWLVIQLKAHTNTIKKSVRAYASVGYIMTSFGTMAIIGIGLILLKRTKK